MTQKGRIGGWGGRRSKREVMGFPGGSGVKKPPASAGDTGDLGSMPGSERPPEEGNGNPLQYSCLGNPLDEEHGGLQSMSHKESDMTEHARACICTHRQIHFTVQQNLIPHCDAITLPQEKQHRKLCFPRFQVLKISPRAAEDFLTAQVLCWTV